jgi:hypothetical protein
MEQRVFDFNIEKKSGIGEIIHGKGVSVSQVFGFSLVIFILIFIYMPWKKGPGVILFRCLDLAFVGLSILQYYKATIRISFDENYLHIKIWRNEHKYLIEDISQITMSYYRVWSFAVLSIRTPSKSKWYSLWASKFERERYELLLSLKDYIKDRLAGKAEFTREPRRE